MPLDVTILRDLARAYRDAVVKDVHDQRRQLWRDHNSLRGAGRVPVLLRFGVWNAWCGAMFADKNLSCQDPFFRTHERFLRVALLHDDFDDDHIIEPWIPLAARGCQIEICLKDVESVEGDPGRLKRWVEIARQVVQETA